jgi:hypothetical protein
MRRREEQGDGLFPICIQGKGKWEELRGIYFMLTSIFQRSAVIAGM